MLKPTLTLLLLIYTATSIAQTSDTIFLKEVTVQKTRKHIAHLKTKGKDSSLSGNPVKSIISRMDEIPAGSLSTVTFYFNKGISSLPEPYQDVELGLLVYGVNQDGSPGQLLTDKEIRFVLRADHRGSIELDLEPLYLNTSQTMYFGIELFEQQQGNHFRIMMHQNAAPTYWKFWDAEEWSDLNIFSGIRMAVDVRLDNN